MSEKLQTLRRPDAALARVDGWWAGKRQKIQAFQAGYVASKRRFFQGLPSHTAPPSGDDVSDASPDRAASRPHYQAESWADAIPADVLELWPCSVQVDTYQAPGGEQYFSATLRVDSAEGAYMRRDVWRQGRWTDGAWRKPEA